MTIQDAPPPSETTNEAKTVTLEEPNTKKSRYSECVHSEKSPINPLLHMITLKSPIN